MKQLKPGDVVAFKLNENYCYAIILSKIIMFGANLVYAFPFATKEIIELNELLSSKQKGFNAIVDFILAKRENRITKLGDINNYLAFKLHKYFKGCHEINTKSHNWFIYDDNNQIAKRTSQLTSEEKEYPFWERIDDTILAKRITVNWLPENDSRV